jgi:hypothetical protein
MGGRDVEVDLRRRAGFWEKVQSVYHFTQVCRPSANVSDREGGKSQPG